MRTQRFRIRIERDGKKRQSTVVCKNMNEAKETADAILPASLREKRWNKSGNAMWTKGNEKCNIICELVD